MRALTSMVARTATRSDFTMCMFPSGPRGLHPWCMVTSLGTLRLVTLTLPCFYLVSDTLVIPQGTAKLKHTIAHPNPKTHLSLPLTRVCSLLSALNCCLLWTPLSSLMCSTWLHNVLWKLKTRALRCCVALLIEGPWLRPDTVLQIVLLTLVCEWQMLLLVVMELGMVMPVAGNLSLCLSWCLRLIMFLTTIPLTRPPWLAHVLDRIVRRIFR